MDNWRLVGDVGGTNARFGRSAAAGVVEARHSYDVQRFPNFMDALKAYLDETGGPANCSGAAIGAAGPVDDNVASLTNASWVIRASEISGLLEAPAVIVNDLEAAAFSLPILADDDLVFLGEPARRSPNPNRLLAANVGTGFGAATLIRAGSSWISIPSEAGHATLGKVTEAEADFPETFASVEHVLSGRGLAELYTFATLKLSRSEAKSLTAAEVVARGKSDECAALAIDYFTRILARTLGDLVLATATWDGVFLFGSVAKAWRKVADLALFRRVFESKGAMTERMKRVPVAVVLRDDAALAGLSFMPLS